MEQQVKTLQEFVTRGVSDLKAIADTGNSIAREWLARIEQMQTAYQKVYLFGEMRVALMRDARPEAETIMERMYPGRKEDT